MDAITDGDHPREYGENVRQLISLLNRLGPSPRIRGKSPLYPGHGKGTGTIPANTGKMVDVPVVCYEGCWRGETTRHTGEVVIHNPGDLPLWPRVRWQGNGVTTVTAPGVGQVELPRTGNRLAVLDTDPAKASMITVGGEPAPDLWRRLRGRVFPQPIPPGGRATWVFGGGATGMVTPLFTSMWR